MTPYAKRLQIEYKDINDVDTRIEVHQAFYAGEVTYREYANNEAACEIEWGDSSSKRLPLVYGSQITLRFDSETDYEFDDFFSSNSRKNKIFYYKNNGLAHVAFGEADTWSEPLSSAPYEVSFTGYDGLGLLSDEDFLDENKEYYEGLLTPLAILQLVLSKTGLDLSLNTAVGIRPVGQPATGDSLLASLKDLISYREMNCYEVLEQLFQGCRIFQRAGEWFIISHEKWLQTSISCYRYSASGDSIGTRVIDTEFDGFWFEGEGSREFLPAIKQITIAQDFGFRSNLVKNHDFAKYFNGNFDDWQAAGTTPVQMALDDEGNKYVLLQGTEPVVPWPTGNHTKYLRTSPISVTATDVILHISIGYGLLGAANSSMFFGLHLVSSGGVHYALKVSALDWTPGSSVIDLNYEWIQTSNNIGVPLSAKVNDFRRSNKREIKPLAVQAHLSDIVNNFTTFEGFAPGLPADGELSLYLFLPDNNDIEIFGAAFSKVALWFEGDNEEDLPTENKISIVNSPGNNFVPDDIEFVNGDLPLYPGRETIYNGGFLLNDGNGYATEAWRLEGYAGMYSYAEFIGRLICSEMQFAKEIYQLTLADVMPGTALVFADVNNSNKRFIEAGITFNDRMSTTEGRYVELRNISLDSFIVRNEYEFTKKAEEKRSSGYNAPTERELVDTDEKVGFVDLEADEFEFEVGYLDKNEFKRDPESWKNVFLLDLEVVCKAGRRSLS